MNNEKDTTKKNPFEGKKLVRSRKDRYIAGVCGGLGNYFDIDPLVFRLLFIILTIFAGSGLIIYIIFWILMPEEDEKRSDDLGENIKEGANKMAQEIKEKTKEIDKEERDKRGRLIGGLIILAVGLIFLFDNILPDLGLNFGKLWPLIIIIIALGIIIDSGKRK
ncbi:MAG: DNA-binding transcriptional activator PspC [candidate division WS2 bacterium ADurb.Bin280]|uniref:DNA-binding transcriptional activator PspC n=1 Tax=candidate division WS2 bacterium ADurb.Bin280 TaxID=1852829 RepID=A0A1V5SDW8_9BACT|nr:MAG: DNA-binding transcriptional activator PspC [candidate division WS2 bacterium ADurb.Bin280]